MDESAARMIRQVEGQLDMRPDIKGAEDVPCARLLERYPPEMFVRQFEALDSDEERAPWGVWLGRIVTYMAIHGFLRPDDLAEFYHGEELLDDDQKIMHLIDRLDQEIFRHQESARKLLAELGLGKKCLLQGRIVGAQTIGDLVLGLESRGNSIMDVGIPLFTNVDDGILDSINLDKVQTSLSDIKRYKSGGRAPFLDLSINMDAYDMIYEIVERGYTEARTVRIGERSVAQLSDVAVAIYIYTLVRNIDFGDAALRNLQRIGAVRNLNTVIDRAVVALFLARYAPPFGRGERVATLATEFARILERHYVTEADQLRYGSTQLVVPASARKAIEQSVTEVRRAHEQLARFPEQAIDSMRRLLMGEDDGPRFIQTLARALTQAPEPDRREANRLRVAANLRPEIIDSMLDLLQTPIREGEAAGNEDVDVAKPKARRRRAKLPPKKKKQDLSKANGAGAGPFHPGIILICAFPDEPVVNAYVESMWIDDGDGIPKFTKTGRYPHVIRYPDGGNIIAHIESLLAQMPRFPDQVPEPLFPSRIWDLCVQYPHLALSAESFDHVRASYKAMRLSAKFHDWVLSDEKLARWLITYLIGEWDERDPGETISRLQEKNPNWRAIKAGVFGPLQESKVWLQE